MKRALRKSSLQKVPFFFSLLRRRYRRFAWAVKEFGLWRTSLPDCICRRRCLCCCDLRRGCAMSLRRHAHTEKRSVGRGWIRSRQSVPDLHGASTLGPPVPALSLSFSLPCPCWSFAFTLSTRRIDRKNRIRVSCRCNFFFFCSCIISTIPQHFLLFLPCSRNGKQRTWKRRAV